MSYSQKVIEHFKNPHNQGTIEDADAVGQEGNPVCGDVMKIYLKIKSPSRRGCPEGAGEVSDTGSAVIQDIKVETLGCAAAIAVSSIATDLAKGRTLDEALKLNKDDVVNELGGLPEQKIHCSMLAIDALHQAINNYKKVSK